MNKKVWIPILAFVAVFALHTAVTVSGFPQMIPLSHKLLGYLRLGSVWLGYSYALVAAFAAYAFLLILERNRRGTAGIVGGVSGAGILYAAGCSLLGCCGSPLLTVYLGAFGSRLAGFTQPIVALVTTLSVLAGFQWMRRGSCGIR